MKLVSREVQKGGRGGEPSTLLPQVVAFLAGLDRVPARLCRLVQGSGFKDKSLGLKINEDRKIRTLNQERRRHGSELGFSGLRVSAQGSGLGGFRDHGSGLSDQGS